MANEIPYESGISVGGIVNSSLGYQIAGAATLGKSLVGDGTNFVSGDAYIRVRKNSTGSTFSRPRLNFIEGTNITLTVADDSTDGEIDITIASSAGGGSVTSVALTMPAIFSVSGSPVTTSGTLAASLATQNANLVFAGPTSGGAATPTFRSLVAADMPSAIDAAKIADGTVSNAEFQRLNGVSSDIQTQIDEKQTADGNLDGISALSGTGIVAHTGSGSFAERTLTAASSKISITNGDGVSGNPTFDITEGNFLGTLIIKRITSVNAKSTGTQTIFQVPSGKSFFCLRYLIHHVTASGAGDDPVVGGGINSNNDVIVAIQALEPGTAQGKYSLLFPRSGPTVAGSTENVTFTIDTASTWTTHTIDVYAIGFLM